MICIPTGIKWNPGYRMNTFLSLVPRSSLGRDYKIREPNVISIIDADYYNNKSNEGEIFINLLNEGNAFCQINAGEKFIQGIIQQYLITSDDNTTTVRTGGFGSTGK
jgi:dUTP pyrophosphatase